MQKQKMKSIKMFSQSMFPRGLCLIVCALIMSQAYSQKDLGKLNSDGNKHAIPYVDTIYMDAVIPSNASYEYLYLEAYGADGGYKRRKSNPVQSRKNMNGGKGAMVQARFKIGNGANEIPPGATIRFVVGQKGEKVSNSTAGAGGGGGTGIAYKGPNSSDKWKLLMVAGGGGGGKGDCCSSGKKGGPGIPYKKGQSLKGFRTLSKYTTNAKYNMGGSAYGGPGYANYENFQREGWLEGPDAGEPTGSYSLKIDEDYYTHGGWGFGAGGVGSRRNAEAGGGGGFEGGYTPKTGLNKNILTTGGSSFVNETMDVSNISSESRGTTDKPKDGWVIYRFDNEGS